MKTSITPSKAGANRKQDKLDIFFVIKRLKSIPTKQIVPNQRIEMRCYKINHSQPTD
ncbi:hypothetical protein [Flavobacterium sp. LM5]|uniref:hypothetical protein n=1 Tax=Flavobacterium sp. LM5 TaxID=1938610 RepID=UPI00167079C4|nr:hypothetical protein [Flavobacterium sp. LM5]